MKRHLSWSRRRSAAVAMVGAIAMVATACGSSGHKSTNGGGGGSTSTPGVTATSITIGATVPLTGPAAPGYSEIAPAANAVFKWINAQGGVDGRKINYTYLDDQYNPSLTAQKVRQLVLQDNIFAEVGGLGTPTQSAVESFFNTEKVPQLFIESGCACWSDPKYPYSFGWMPNYIVEGKILATYIKSHFAGQKIGLLYQDDEFGEDNVKGVEQIIPASQVVSSQTYDVSTLSGPLSNQVAALKAAGAQVVFLFTVPAATALTLLPAAAIGYHPQWVISNVGDDPPTIAPLLSSFSKGAAGGALLNGVISDAYIPPEAQTDNAWVQVTKKLLADYDPGAPLDGNTEYGVALGYTFVQALQFAGKNLTRQSLLNALEKDGSKFVTPSFTPFAYSTTDHYGMTGDEMVQITNGATNQIKVLSPVYVSTNSGPVTVYHGKTLAPPASLSSTA
ncbi:MAG: ABC transporter substrate-binding protein [Acidimicrobiales bacterium]